MSEDINNNTAEPTEEINTETKPEVNVEELVAERVKTELAKVKNSLDSAYKERDSYKAQVAELDKAKRTAEIEALEKAGKHTEVLKMEMNTIKQELNSYKEINTKLSRDNVVKSHLTSLEFRNEKAAALAHADIIATLKQDTQGNWVHETGASLEDAINDYAKSDANSFMFKVKENAGSGISQVKPTTATPNDTAGKKAHELSQDELLKAIETGAVTPSGTWNQ